MTSIPLYIFKLYTMRTSLLINLFLIFLVIIFAIQNSAPIGIKLLFWNVKLSPAFLVILVLILGVLLGIFVSSLASIDKARKRKEAQLNKKG